MITCALGTALLLAGCGFRPLYGRNDGPSGAPSLVEVDIDLIKDREGQILRNFLIDRFQPNGAGRYRLETALIISEQDLGVAEDATTTRSRVLVTANFKLRYGDRTYRFSSRGAGSFSTVQSDYGTLVARQDATERSLRSIADEAKVRVSTFLKTLGG